MDIKEMLSITEASKIYGMSKSWYLKVLENGTLKGTNLKSIRRKPVGFVIDQTWRRNPLDYDE